MAVMIAEITGGELPEGAALPPEKDLAARFNVSRGILRESLRGLEERGLVRVRHGRGASVAPSGDWNVLDPEVLQGVLAGERAERARAEWGECRRVLEVEAAALAARRATDGDVRRLEQALAALQRHEARAGASPGAVAAFADADRHFHEVLLAATGNPSLARLAEPIQEALARTERARWTPEAMAAAVADHRRIVAAVAEGDADGARAAMRAHLEAHGGPTLA